MNMSGNANSTYNLSGGSATFARINVNETAGAGASYLTIEGGTLTIPQSNAGGGQGALFIGSGTGHVAVAAGTLNVGGDTAGNQSIVVGNGGSNKAVLFVGGTGLITVVGSGNVEVGSSSPGVVNQSGGTVNLFTGPGANSWLHVGDGANGTYDLSGGSLTATNPVNDLVLGNVGSGTFNLNCCGTATLGAIFGFGSSSTFNLNGGTLRPNADQSLMDHPSFMSGLTAANVQIGGAIIDTNGFNVTIAQPLIHDPALGSKPDGGLTKNGAGALTLSGNNTFNGTVQIDNGTLKMGSATAINGNNVSIAGGTLSLNGNPVTINGLDSTSGTAGIVENASSTPAALDIDQMDAGTHVYNGVLQDGAGGGALSLIKTGIGTQQLGGNNSFTGAVTIYGGELKLANPGALNATNVVIVSGLTSSGTLTLNGNSVAVAGLAGSPDLSVVQNASATPATLTFNVAGGFEYDCSTPVQDGAGGGALALVKVGNGFQGLYSGNNTFTGGVTINAGTLLIATGALNATTPNPVAFGANSTGTLGLVGGGLVKVGGLATDATVGSPVVTAFGAPATLEVGNSSPNTFAGVLQDGAGGGTLSLAKSGTGTLTINGTNAYTGNTTVNAGTLRFAVSGSPKIGAGATATVASGATLELAGTISALSFGSGRVTIVNNSNAPGLLVSGTNQQVGNIDGSGTTQVNAGSDLTANHIIQGTLVIGGTSKNPGLVTIDASDASGNPLASLAILAAPTPAISMGAGGNLTDPLINAINSDSLPTSSPPFDSSLTSAPAAVPEPSSLLLLVVSALALGGAAFRRRKRA
jgi:autotransporter-associated beta strand protein